MKFYITNQALDEQIADIQRTIMLSMNGIVSTQMSDMGIVYRKNYGVTIPRIKEIASTMSPNHDLAQRLWHLQIRETMIMATILQPVDKMSRATAEEWLTQFNQIEIVEQACMNLFAKLPYAAELSCQCIASEKLWEQITGYILIARIYKELNTEQINAIITSAINTSNTDNLHLYKAIALCLSRLCRTNKSVAKFILQEIEPFKISTSKGQTYIYNEVAQEILFLDIL